MASAGQGILPIREISAYHNRWTIRARVTNKGSLRTFTKGANGGGKVFGVELLDAEGGEIRASFFNQAADLFFDKLIVGKIFNLSRGQAKVANRQYNICNHRYELTFDKDALVEEATDEGEQIQKVKFNFVDVKSVSSKSLPCRVDLCGVVTAARPFAEIQTKDGRSSVKRDITVADDSGASIDVILWGEHAKLENEKFECQPSVALKGVLIKEWNGGRGGSLSESGTILLAPELPEAVKVREWWVTGGSSQAIAGLSVSGGAGMGPRPLADVRVKSLAEVRAACDRLGSEAEMYATVAWLGSVQLRKQGEKAPLWYHACAEAKERRGLPCNKRVDESGFCQSCGRQGKVAVRLLARCRFSDFSDSTFFTTFHEASQHVLGMPAETLKSVDLEDSPDKGGLEAKLKEQYFARPLQLTLRARMDT